MEYVVDNNDQAHTLGMELAKKLGFRSFEDYLDALPVLERKVFDQKAVNQWRKKPHA